MVLYSPQIHFSQPTSMIFWYHMWLNATDSVASLTVYTYSLFGSYDRQLFKASGNHGSSWQSQTLCLPVGNYKVAFVGTVGMTYLSDIGIDSVTLDYATPCTVSDVQDGSGVAGKFC